MVDIFPKLFCFVLFLKEIYSLTNLSVGLAHYLKNYALQYSSLPATKGVTCFHLGLASQMHFTELSYVLGIYHRPFQDPKGKYL